jgi:CheY-like chemotaxis protein/anti-sigma regulatory factor (Ser/Thr protein kinase)
MDALRPLQSKELGGEIIDKVQLSLKGLNGMLHSLLDIAELDANTVQNRPTHLSLYTVVESIVTEYQSKASHLELRNEVDRGLVVFCDQTILYRVVRNLLDNAVKYTEQGQVVIECEHKANTCDLYIRDSGVGIPQDQIDFVFDEFHQLNNPERDRDKGLGLGLSIVKRLCDLASIDLQLQSQPGKGSTVMLKLATGIETAITESGLEQDINFSGELIVIIDDEQDIRQAMQLVLTALHAEVIVAESLDQLMRELAQVSAPPSIIISDFRLRDNATGAQAIDAIREEYNREIPAIIITGDTGAAKLSEMRGATDCVLYKPVDTKELQESIASLLVKEKASST